MSAQMSERLNYVLEKDLRQDKYRVIVVYTNGKCGAVELFQKNVALHKIGQGQEKCQQDAYQQRTFDRTKNNTQNSVGESDNPFSFFLAEKKDDDEKYQLDDDDYDKQSNDGKNDGDKIIDSICSDYAHSI